MEHPQVELWLWWNDTDDPFLKQKVHASYDVPSTVLLSADSDTLRLDFGLITKSVDPISLEADREHVQLDIPKDYIRLMSANVVDDPGGEFLRANDPYSSLAISYRDPFGVEEQFTTKLCGQRYWIKAARKLVAVRLGLTGRA